MNIRSTALLSRILGCFIILGCQSALSQEYVLGPSYFEEGDSIILTDVQSELGTFQTGDTINIKGTYRFADRAEAKLLLTVAQTEGKKSQRVDPNQWVVVKGDAGKFELGIVIPVKGYLHLSLRTASGEDQSFGSLCFGTKEQMEEIKDWDISKRYKK